jgi:hypothetical protein
MKLFPGIKRSATWHVSKFFVVATLMFIVVVYYHSKPQTNEIESRSVGHRSILSTSNVVLDGTQTKMLSSSMRKLLSEKSVAEEEGGGDTDEDGNSKICHKAPQYRGDQCAFVMKNCPQPLGGSYINYLLARYCWFQNAPAVFFILAVCY